ncbi:hypothetical protein GVX82_02535 [Patescibacteria group bacterium]|jgi:myo-inositol-1-phosphate synthase|nr:hypothetical protein [Patescibacteria group bacterium]
MGVDQSVQVLEGVGSYLSDEPARFVEQCASAVDVNLGRSVDIVGDSATERLEEVSQIPLRVKDRKLGLDPDRYREWFVTS